MIRPLLPCRTPFYPKTAIAARTMITKMMSLKQPVARKLTHIDVILSRDLADRVELLFQANGLAID